MNEHCTPEANRNTFDGDAISRADREFLASLGDHPLVRNPLYGVPCPPQPDFDRFDHDRGQERRRKKRASRQPSTGCW